MELYIIGFAFYFGVVIKEAYHSNITGFKNYFLYMIGLIIWPVLAGVLFYDI